MNKYLVILTYTLTATVCHDRMPPGINPSQYQPHHQQIHQTQYPQQPPAPQHHQQHIHQQQHQQVPVQQIPQHQQQQIPQHQQQQPPPPPQQAHQHEHQNLLNAENIAHEKDHIQEHLNVPIDTSKMSEEELQFHYFKIHDADNNNKLDGCELIKSLIHWHEHGHKDPATGQVSQPQEKLFSDDELVQLIDPIMNMDDSNGDGYIDYPEFVRAQQKATKRAS